MPKKKKISPKPGDEYYAPTDVECEDETLGDDSEGRLRWLTRNFYGDCHVIGSNITRMVPTVNFEGMEIAGDEFKSLLRVEVRNWYTNDCKRTMNRMLREIDKWVVI